MKKIFYVMSALILAVLLAAQAYAAPVAKVAAFPDGVGLEEFLSGIDTSKITRTERPEGLLYPAAVVVLPLLEGSHAEVYRAQFDEENFEVVYRLGDAAECLIQGETDRGLLFWCHVPEVIPEVVVVVYETDEEGGYTDHQWSPQFSGDHGSLITDDRFVGF